MHHSQIIKMSNQSEIEKALKRILEITSEIVQKSVDGDCLYRGEPEHYEKYNGYEEYNGKVSSSLYRLSPAAFDAGKYNLKNLQETSLKDARNYIRDYEKEGFELLTELQHPK